MRGVSKNAHWQVSQVITWESQVFPVMTTRFFCQALRVPQSDSRFWRRIRAESWQGRMWDGKAAEARKALTQHMARLSGLPGLDDKWGGMGRWGMSLVKRENAPQGPARKGDKGDVHRGGRARGLKNPDLGGEQVRV